MLPYLVCAIMMVPIGNLADKIGYRQSIIIFGGSLQLVACIMFLILPDSNRCVISVVPWILLGLNQSIFCVLQWGCLSYHVPEEVIGTAYGIIACFQNLGCTIMPPVVGYIHDNTQDYMHGFMYVEIFMISCSFICLILKILLLRWDNHYRNGVLQSINPMTKYEYYLNKQTV